MPLLCIAGLAHAQGDFAAVLKADLDYRAALGEDTRLDLSCGLNQSPHDQFSAFDVQNHMLSGDLSQDFGATDAGATVRRIETRLDNEAYLAMTQFAPWASRFFGRHVFVRADYTMTDKDFEDLPARDAVQRAAGGDAFWFLDGARTYLLAGYRYRPTRPRTASRPSTPSLAWASAPSSITWQRCSSTTCRTASRAFAS